MKDLLIFDRNYTIIGNVLFAGVMELADVVDSKSTGGDTVPVRVRPPAPPKSRRYDNDGFLYFLLRPQALENLL